MKIWRILAALCMIGALVFCFAACGTAPAEPTIEPTEATDATDETAPLVDPETFKDFIGTWYADGSSASYRIIIKQDATWSLLDSAEEALLVGTVDVTADNKAVSLYDFEGSQAFDLQLEDAGKLHVEVYADSMIDMLTSNTFLSEVTNSESPHTPFNEGDSVVDVPIAEAPASAEESAVEEVAN